MFIVHPSRPHYFASPFYTPAPQPTARERYLQALLEEQTAREEYARRLRQRGGRREQHPLQDAFYGGHAYNDYLPAAQEPRRRGAELSDPARPRRAPVLSHRRSDSDARTASQSVRIPISTGRAPAVKPSMPIVPEHPAPAPSPSQTAENAVPPGDVVDESSPAEDTPAQTAEDTDSMDVPEAGGDPTAQADIAKIAADLATLRNSFVFPAILDRTPSGTLAFTATNVPVRAHEEALARLLARLDAVESGGVPSVRSARRTVVRDIEEELAALDARVRKALALDSAAEAVADEHDAVAMDLAAPLSSSQKTPIEVAAEDIALPDDRDDELEDMDQVDASLVDRSLPVEHETLNGDASEDEEDMEFLDACDTGLIEESGSADDSTESEGFELL